MRLAALKIKISEKQMLLILLTVFLILTLIYSAVTPAFEAPDEVQHFSTVSHFVNKLFLPRQQLGDSRVYREPPLYYILTSLLTWPANLKNQTGAYIANPDFMWSGDDGLDINAGLHGSAETFPYRGHALALHLARFSSILMGMATIIFTVLISRRLFPNHPMMGFLPGIFIAFNPQFLFLSSTVNNENLMILVVTLCCWQLLRVMLQPEQWKQWAYVGIITGAAFLTKTNGGLVIGATVYLTLLICALRRKSFKLFINGAALIVLFTFLISGWWFIRNIVLYGDFLGNNIWQNAFASNFQYSAQIGGKIGEFFLFQFHSFWGLFGWINVQSPNWYYLLFGVLSFLSIAGLIIRVINKKLPDSQTFLWIPLLIAILVQLVISAITTTQCKNLCYPGSHLFPVITPMMILLSWGMTGILPIQPEVDAKLIMSAIIWVLVCVSVFVPVGVIQPAYDIQPLSKWESWFIPHKLNIDFGDMFKLKGYTVSEKDDSIKLTLYWQGLKRPDFNYSAFVHLIDENDQIITQIDHAPGEKSGYPPIAWLTGDILADKHRLVIPNRSPTNTYRFRIGLYNWVTGEQLPAYTSGNLTGNYVILDHTIRR